MKDHWNGYSAAVPLVLVAIAASTLLMRADPPTNCGPMEANLRIQVGGASLSVPRRYAPNIYGPDGHSVGIAKEICQRQEDPAIVSSAVTIEPGDHLPFQAEPEPLTAPIWKVQIRIRERPPSFDAPERQYQWTVDLTEKGGLQLSELPRRHGFIAHDGSPRGLHQYVALPGTSESLDPAPLVIDCAAQEIEIVSPHGRTYYGHSCSTTYYSVSDALVVSYRFYDGQHPVETWGNLDASVRAFVRSLVTDGDH